jgi:hypothetical protein
MNPYDPPLSDLPAPVAAEEDHREAPSAIIDSCRSVARWQLISAICMLTLSASLPWALAEVISSEEANMRLRNEPVPEHGLLILNVMVSTAILAGSWILFRSSRALHAFTVSRKVQRLHPALCRLRAAWRLLAVTGLIFAAVIILGMITVLRSP